MVKNLQQDLYRWGSINAT